MSGPGLLAKAAPLRAGRLRGCASAAGESGGIIIERGGVFRIRDAAPLPPPDDSALKSLVDTVLAAGKRAPPSAPLPRRPHK